MNRVSNIIRVPFAADCGTRPAGSALLLRIAFVLLAIGSGFARDMQPRSHVPEAPRPSAAAVALFVNSNLDSARALATTALRQDPRDVDAWFVQMEAAALQADSAGGLDAALRICESASSNDPRLTVAASRIIDLAGNTQLFRRSVPRIERLIAAQSPAANMLRGALVAAATDGVPGLSVLHLARQSGLITDWRIAGPFGKYPNVAFDRTFAPERDATAASYEGRAVENFRFDDGTLSLPDYLGNDGVFYAASEVQTAAAGAYRLRVESGGTLQIFVDGAIALTKDDRFRTTAEINWSTLHLAAGPHRVLVKFLPSAAPFRIALEPDRPASVSTPAVRIADPEAGYAAAAERFWMGDYQGAIAQLTRMRAVQASAPIDFLLAQAWSHSAADTPEEPALLEAALKQAPLAMAAEYRLAERAYNGENSDEAFARAQRVAAAQPGYVPAQHLLAQAAVRLNWHAEAAQAFEAELRLQPSCATVRDAAKFFSSIAAYDRAAEVERQLEGCAPGSLAHAQALAESGRHAEAAGAAQRIAAERPLDREARALLARELAAADNFADARYAAAQLLTLAPNADRYRTLAARVANGAAVADAVSPRAREFAAESQFYTAFRRNGLDITRKAANRRFSGGPAVFVLYDRVAKLEDDGSVALYVHKITRVLNRDGIEKYGEVTTPRSADLLELRTIKQDGTIVEPEFSQHKSSVSMPALAPGDAIEQEFVVRYPGGIGQNPDAFTYTFGSFNAPILYARFVALTPACVDEAHCSTQFQVVGNVPAPVVGTTNGVQARVWEQESIAQSTDEASAPHRDTLPTVHVVEVRAGGWAEVRDFYRNELIEALRVSSRVTASAGELRGATPEETARKMYQMVTTRLRSIDSTFEDGEIASAENTLANYAGSRTAALMAMAHAAGIDAELLLAREVGRPRPALAVTDAYTHPLVRFHFGQKEVVADAESDGLAFGGVPPTLVREDAFLVPLTDAAAQSAELLTALPSATGDEHSVADGDITFDTDGNLNATVNIRMGVSRSAQMRSVLVGIAPGERKRFFEQLAQRIFSGAIDANGTVENEHDSESPLELRFTCRAPHFFSFTGAAADLEQLAPALGLRKMYGLGPRRLPLYIDTPLVETTTFRVHLPAQIQVTGRASNLKLSTDFGSYEVEFTQPAPGELQVRRAFRVPVQLIPADHFDAFARFERQIDEVERQRISLGRVPLPAGATAAGGN